MVNLSDFIKSVILIIRGINETNDKALDHAFDAIRTALNSEVTRYFLQILLKF